MSIENRCETKGKGRYKTPLGGLIAAHCRDYFRREELISGDEVSRRVRMEYVFLNSKIFEAVAEIIGEPSAEAMIREIGEGIGYASSKIDFLSEGCYKSYKSECVTNIARRLHLID